MIKELDFIEMHDIGVNFFRLSMGYWKIVDLSYNFNGSDLEAEKRVI